MADIAKALKARLAAVAAVTTLIGNRVYPDTDRQSSPTYPLAVYKIETSSDQCFDGPSGIETAVIRIAAAARTYDQASQVAAAIQKALDGQGGTWANTVVQGVFLQDDGVTDAVQTDPTTAAILFYVKQLAFDSTYNTASPSNFDSSFSPSFS